MSRVIYNPIGGCSRPFSQACLGLAPSPLLLGTVKIDCCEATYHKMTTFNKLVLALQLIVDTVGQKKQKQNFQRNSYLNKVKNMS